MNGTFKIIILILFCILVSCGESDKNKTYSISDDKIQIEVNPTIDLFSLIHRLAGDKQYNETLLPDYMTEVDNYFDKFKNHPTIEFAKECNQLYQINGDAPMSLARYVGPPPALQTLIELSNLPPTLDPRWDSALISNYLKNARIFADESGFIEFYNKQKDYHAKAIANLRKMIDAENIFQWYLDFFGYYPENFKMYVALLNGSCNYGYPITLADSGEEFVSLIGGRFPNRQGFPTYEKNWFLPVIIHEFTHSYINPIIKSNPAEFKQLGESLLEMHRQKMIEKGYNVWNVILQEYIVRACTIRYLEESAGKREARKWMNNDIKSGFSEIEGLVDLLDEYENNRIEYTDIESFLPQIKNYFEIYLDLSGEVK